MAKNYSNEASLSAPANVGQWQFAPTFPPLNMENRPAVPTEQAAYYLHRRPQTLRKWAVYDGTGPVRPVRCNGRLLWPLDQIRAVIGVSKKGMTA